VYPGQEEVLKKVKASRRRPSGSNCRRNSKWIPSRGDRRSLLLSVSSKVGFGWNREEKELGEKRRRFSTNGRESRL